VDKDSAKKALRHIESNGWNLKTVINTHYHADHTGGNAYIQQRTGCDIYAAPIDCAFTNHTQLEPSYLYGAYPPKPLNVKFLKAKPSYVQPLSDGVLPEGLSILHLDGHSFANVAIRTKDGVWFLGDCLTSAAIIEKYHVSFVYDVAEYLRSLETVKSLEGKLFIPSHAKPTADIAPLAEINRLKVLEIISLLKDICAKPRGLDEILKAVFDHYDIKMDFTQSVLVGSTIKSYLAYLYDAGETDVCFEGNMLSWYVKSSV
ncbi:MAG: MBL fold metallo-hydrolase, partial [Clostridia bacterium]|nr:MBL fold metallo-hydrolase [Clostridia bacterium]